MRKMLGSECGGCWEVNGEDAGEDAGKRAGILESKRGEDAG